MSLKIYKNISKDNSASTGSSFRSPIRITVDNTRSMAIVKKVFLGNTNPDLWFSNIQASLYDSTGYSTNEGIKWKLSSSTREVFEEEWENVSHNNTISISNIGSSSQADTATYHTIWIRIEVPNNIATNSITDLSLKIEAKRNLVDVSS